MFERVSRALSIRILLRGFLWEAASGLTFGCRRVIGRYMSKKLSLWVGLASFFVAGFAASGAAQASWIQGAVQVGPFLNCQVRNPFPYTVNVQAVQYQFSCMDPFSGFTAHYNPAVTCVGNCVLVPGFFNQFSGPSTFNCNLVAASCQAIVFP